MSDFTTKLSNIVVSSTEYRVDITNQFINITGTELLTKLRRLPIGEKEGSHFIRTSLNTNDENKCLPRSNANTYSLASMLILDCDKRIDTNGEEKEGAPEPDKISEILRENNIAHILYGSYSHYVGNKGNRYRIILITQKPYSKEQLESTLVEIISLINTNLDGDLLVNAAENSTWSQPWYYPRRPENSTVDALYLEYLDGKTIDVIEKIEMPASNKMAKRASLSMAGKISPIDAFNEQYSITDLLNQYGYKKTYSGTEYERWLSPHSTSGVAGIIVKNKKFFSHHGSCPFHDGYWHDAFDMMKTSEALSENEAIIKVAKNTWAPDGRTVDEYNKSLSNRQIVSSNPISNPILHIGILDQLLEKIIPVNFRQLANIVDERERLKSHHFYVIVIETILQLAKENNWHLCRNHDFIYLYNGEYWSLLSEGDLKVFLGKAAEKMAVNKFYARYFNFIEQLYKQFLMSGHLSKPANPKNVTLINLKNGTFEISSNGTRLKPFDSNDFLTYQLPFNYEPEAQCPLFTAYLNKVLPDKALQNILSEFLGYVFVRAGTLKLEKALLLYGKGANGKSVFYEVIRQLFGAQNVSEYSLQTLTDDRGYSRAMMSNKLLNYASEITGKLGIAIFKQMASGEPVEARLPYGNPFIMADYGKMIFNCNDLPKDVEHNEAYFRRLLIIPFNITIPENEQDKQLAQKIIDTELSGVFNWVLEGLNRLLRQKKFTVSEAVCQERIQYEKESDSVRLFLDEIGYVSSHAHWIQLKQLYTEYRGFCIEDGYKPVNSLNFRKRLESAKIVVERKNMGKIVFLSKDNEYGQVK